MENIFGSRLRELRKSRNMSQTELADALGTSQSTIADYERGKVFPTVPVIIRIAKFLNVSADYLLGLTDNPQPWSNDLPESVKKQLERCHKILEIMEEFKKLNKKLDDV